MSTGAAAASRCRNCGADADGKYCPECGQETAMHPPSTLEFLHEFIGHYVALEGALWRTLAKLVRPGALTLEYFGNTAMGGNVTFVDCKPGEVVCERIRQRLVERFGAMTGPKVADYLMSRLVALFPYAMFVLVPVFALLTRAVYWNRPYNYGEHLVFALHYHSAVFLIGAVTEPFHQAMLWTIPSAIYLMVAMVRVFGGRTWVSVLRGPFVFLAYFALIVACMMAIVTASILL